MKQGIWRALQRDDGSNVVELAVLMPVLLLLLAGAVDFGRAYYVAIEVNSAAHAGALYGSQNPTDTAGMIAAAQLDASDITLQLPTVTSGCECFDRSNYSTSLATCMSEADPCVVNGNVGNLVYWSQVTTSATYNSILKFPGLPASLTLTGQSTMRAAY
jgi:Flp pilus assembly protein TadG